MNTVLAIRQRLGLTQAALAELLGCTQGNVSFYEKGQTVPPPVAGRLIEVARERNHSYLTFDHVYGAAELPPPTTESAEAKAA
jgi:putative transcriptional regulator